MSLLLDALKRAEQEKLARQSEAPAQKDSPARAPPPPAREPPRVSPALTAPVGLQLVDGGSGHVPPRVERPDAPPIHDDAAGARHIFAAKSAGRPKRRPVALWIALGSLALLFAAGGGFVWYTVKGLSSPSAVTSRPPPPPVAPVAPAPTPSPAASPVPSPGRIEAPALTAVLSEPERETAPRPGAARPPAEDAEQMVTNLLRDMPDTARAPGLKLSRSSAPAGVRPEIAEGYAALRAGDIAAARRAYLAALAADPANVDAELGLATIEARLGQRAAAAERYRRVLALDPRNAAALAGLASLADFSRPETLETQLRTDLAAHPGSAALHATLGSLYASQRRWNQAQAAYFEAHRLDPGNADVLYNLAVSLDHLGQSRLAADFYARSLEASRGLATPFDRAGVERRLAEIRAGR